MQYIYDSNPFTCPGIVDGHLISGFAGIAGSAQNPLAAKTNSSIGNQNAVYNLLISGSHTIYNSLLDNSIKLNHKMDYLLPGLNAHATVSYQDNYNRLVKYTPSIPSYTIQRNAENPNNFEFFGGSMSGGRYESYGYSNWNKLYIDASVDWAGAFGKHNVSALFLGKASKYTMPNDTYHVPSGIMGFVGRATYNYDNKYMAEINAGYNGTEQFREGKRFGLFPALSIGWVPTAESFFPKNNILTFMKIRASYGEVGNDQLACPCLDCLFLKPFELVCLTYVSADSDDLRIIVVFLEPWDDDGCVESSRICHYDFLDILVFHFCNPFSKN
jgi:hypothetical protein